MDEARKNQALIKMILERANSISSTMTDVNERLTTLNQKMETQHIREPARPPMELLDLHMSILAHVVSSLTEAKALSALGMTCRTMTGMRKLTSTVMHP
mmetsp:Transcript_45294/g.115939  ORF Transcript_45294/g.115939 Transcript_45294/m.115939 type:complete len:99 (-) Transcript_45294:1378-1674(-)